MYAASNVPLSDSLILQLSGEKLSFSKNMANHNESMI